MKKFVIKFFTTILAFICMFSFVACFGGGNGNGNEDAGGDDSTTEQTQERDYNVEKTSTGDFLHNVKVSKTEDFFIKDGTTEYKIVYPNKQEVDPDEDMALSELRDLVKEATGISLEAVEDTEVGEFSEDAKYISISDNKYYHSADLDLDLTLLNQNGFYIKSKGNSVFIVGYSGKGAINGVYDFLAYNFGYEFYAKNSYVIDDMVNKDVPMLSWDVEEAPDIRHALYICNEVDGDPATAKKLRMITNGTVFARLGRDVTHNTLREEAVDPKKYYEDHEEWFYGINSKDAPIDKGQLCYTAHGIPEEYEALVNEVVEIMKKVAIKSPDAPAIPFVQMDNLEWCNCGSCSAVINNNFGAKAATQTLFINDVAEKLQEWLATEMPGRDLRIVVNAYHATSTAPAKDTNKDGIFEPSSQDMILNPIVTIKYAPYNEQKLYFPFNSQENKSARDQMEAWDSLLTAGFYCWFYTTHYVDGYFYPFDNITSMQKTIQYLAEKGTEYLAFQGSHNTCMTGWVELKGWLQSKLAWDCNLDFNTLVNKFFKDNYGLASNSMMGYFENYRLYMKYLSETEDVCGRPEQDGSLTSGRVWNERILKQWKQYFTKAYEDIELIEQDDYKKYIAIRERIEKQEVLVDALLYNHQINTLTQDEQLVIENNLRARFEKFGILYYKNGGSVKDFFG